MQKHQDPYPQPPRKVVIVEPNMLCGRPMTVHLDYAIREEYQDHTLYFCTESCLNAFKADPERFYCAHSKTNPK